MKRKLAFVASLVLLGCDMFPQAFIQGLPVIDDSVMFSIESFHDNGDFFNHISRTYDVPGKCSKSVTLKLVTSKTFAGEVLVHPEGVTNPFMYAFVGYLHNGNFTFCTSSRELIKVNDQLLIVTENGLARQEFRTVTIRRSPRRFRD